MNKMTAKTFIAPQQNHARIRHKPTEIVRQHHSGSIVPKSDFRRDMRKLVDEALKSLADPLNQM